MRRGDAGGVYTRVRSFALVDSGVRSSHPFVQPTWMATHLSSSSSGKLVFRGGTSGADDAGAAAVRGEASAPPAAAGNCQAEDAPEPPGEKLALAVVSRGTGGVDHSVFLTSLTI